MLSAARKARPLVSGLAVLPTRSAGLGYRGFASKPKRHAEKYDPTGFFSTGSKQAKVGSEQEKFTILTPPPNVTGNLHIGHALTASIQDSIVRWRRMLGQDVSWVPGMDHAGISTQTVVEKKVWREQKKTRHDLGRDRFIDEIWAWKALHGDRITQQLQRLGASLDWDNSFFTLDETRSAAVQSAFIQLYQDGLVYRDTRLVNWCCALETVISDIEVDHIDIPGRTLLSVPGRLKKVEFGVLHDFAYKVHDMPDQELVVSTTRIETMLGDEAIAVHPDDTRYTHLHGKFVVHPINGRKLPIICDAELVDKEFGTGVVKVTPAHDPNDYACGKRHGLPIVNMLDKEGRFNSASGASDYVNLNRFDARDKIIQQLKDLGLYRGKNENHAMRLAQCSRSGDVIEPMVLPQWYIKCDGLAKRGIESAAKGDLVFHPNYAIKDWNRWLENIQDWCISRQLWWGHRIPAYRVQFAHPDQVEGIFERGAADGPWFVAESKEEAAQQVDRFLSNKGFQGAKYSLVQDDDVLDTWFSSGLLPLSALGWTGNQGSAPLPPRYPTNVIETGTDIMFFWVARMVMLCTHFSGQVPFKDVMFHAMVRDAQGRKMSKSVGNVIDPTHVIEGITLQELRATLEGGNLAAKEVKRSQAAMDKQFPHGIKASGADALRFALVSATQHTRQINLDLANVTSAQHFANKLWNLAAFARTRFEVDQFETSVHTDSALARGLSKENERQQRSTMSLVERFILSRLSQTVAQVNESMSGFEPSTATDSVRRFIVQDLCDVYVEFCKPTLFRTEEDPALQAQKTRMLTVLQTCFDASLRMLHPFMPFVTEELWQRTLPATAPQDWSIMTSSFPVAEDFGAWKDDQADRDMTMALEIIQASRSLRNSHQVPITATLPMTIWTDDSSLLAPEGALTLSTDYLQQFTRPEGPIQFVHSSDSFSSEKEDHYAVHVVSPTVKLLVPLTAIRTAIDQAAVAAAAADGTKAESAAKTKQERARLDKKLKAVESDLEKLITRTGRPEYAERVPSHVRQMDEQRYAALMAQKEHLRSTIDLLSKA
ncbi:hypothetical protein DFQ27_003900 [Actinomortierella ambigua]|uniref:Probable valine--tRNA ligase, cytoplasmic n=1 Tax=Actinomortierella ambigua TaxID=1343610 RepID=A0A9P6U563_9FUNG|nr:hypothetical protein DFQ27_003900 [Actinomortierella ambigua]